MSYREPGSTITQEKRQVTPSGAAAPSMTLIVSYGPTTLTKTVKLTRGSGAYDVVMIDGKEADLTAIVRLGKTDSTSDYNTGAHTDDCAVATETIGGVQVDVLKWKETGTPVKPGEGEIYYATVSYNPGAEHYETQLLTQLSDVTDKFGKEVINSKLNPIAIAANIALANSPAVLVKKVKQASGDVPTVAELQAALDSFDVKTEEAAVRIIPVGFDGDGNSITIDHVRKMSTPDEGYERVTLLQVKHTSTTFNEVLSNVGGWASALKEQRVATFYPDKGTRVLDDGKEYVLEGSYIAVELAAKRTAMHPNQSYTNMQVTAFNELKGVKMTRPEKRRLADKGVMVIEQDKKGQVGTVLHGLSTDRTGLQEQEFALVELSDRWAKEIRPVLKPFKGQPIVGDFMDRLRGNVEAKVGALVKQKMAVSASVVEIGQLEDAPDTVYVKIRVAVPYPCNYIDVVIAYI